MKNSASAPGKIILTGEYAVVFGYSGIAIPSPLKMKVEFEDDRNCEGIEINWEGIKGDEGWNAYLKDILNQIQKFKGMKLQGNLKIINELPLGKGMGSSTSLVIAVSRCLLAGGTAPARRRAMARAIENKLSPNNSGMDFNVIWEDSPIFYKKDEGCKPIELPTDLLADSILIDTGKPNETTSELVKIVTELKEKDPKIEEALRSIGDCTQRLADGDDLESIIKDNYPHQLTLGIVPQSVQDLITQIEESGGSAKVLGAGGQTGGGGMVLAIHKKSGLLQDITSKHQLKYHHL